MVVSTERLIHLANLIADKDSEIAKLRGVLARLEREATEVSRQGAIPGRQWTLLAGALITARATLKETDND